MFITKYKHVASLAATKETAIGILQALDCSTALAVAIMIRYDDYTDYAALTIRTADFLDVNAFRDAYFAYNLLRKLEGLTPSDDLDEASYKKYVSAELACRATNELFVKRSLGHLKFNGLVERVLFYARRKIGDILAVSRIWEHDAGFGPGASSSCRGEYSHLLWKTATYPICNRNLWPSLRCYIKDSVSYLSAITNVRVSASTSLINPVYQEFNELTTVPKDFRSNRVIAIEPDGNIFYQKMLGKWIRCCLRAAGLDLNNRQPVNGRLAREGSINDRFATIDFESASDTVSYELVKDLLPAYAFRQLDKSRSSHTMLPNGRLVKNAKFSSMGNGFTFELETLIFYSILYGCYKELGIRDRLYDSPSCNMSVFGDDVICLKQASEMFIQVCTAVGFKVNKEKTFTSGPFRESCGYDYYAGISVKPLRIKKLLKTDFDRIDLANRMRLIYSIGDYSDGRFKRTWERLIRPINRELKNFGPFGSFNTVIWTSIHDTAYPRSFNGFRLWIRRPKLLPRREDSASHCNAAYVSAMYYVSPSALSLSKRGPGRYYSMKNSSIDCFDQSWGRWLT